MQEKKLASLSSERCDPAGEHGAGGLEGVEEFELRDEPLVLRYEFVHALTVGLVSKPHERSLKPVRRCLLLSDKLPVARWAAFGC